MSGLSGIRVMEIGGGVAVAYAGKLFADLGADVIRLESTSDAVRRRPHDVHRWLNTNKRSMTDRPATVERLLPGAHLVLHDLDDTTADIRGLGPARVADSDFEGVVCSLTPWGPTGPYAGYRAEELSVIHGSSWGFLSPGAATHVDLPPLKAPGHHASINVATGAATAALAALDRRERTGFGEYIAVSMFAAAAKMTEFAPATVSFLGFNPSRLGTKSVVPWGTYRCRDGLIQITCPEENQWQALVTLMGEPDWASVEVLATAEGRRRNPDLVDIYLAEWCAEQQLDDLTREGQRLGICVTPVNTVADLAANEHLAARGFIATDPAGVVMPGPAAQTDQGWWALRAEAPAPGAHDGEDWHPAPILAAAGAAAGQPGRPLEGIRVIDFSWVWAGPFCTQQLAHLGADVIRLESPHRPDIFRRMPFTPKGIPRTLDTSGPFQLYNSDKRSIAVDLTSAAGRDLVLELVAAADVVVDNFSVGTMDQLGFGVEDLRRVNPSVIVASMSGYGQTGPSSSFTAYGPAGGAMAGLYAANGYSGGETAETGIAVGDPGLGLATAWAIVAALVARRRHGDVARIDAAMIEAVAATTGELWMEWVATGHPPPRRGNRDPGWAPHNCYPCEGQDQWVTIACTDDAEWRALADIIGLGDENAEDFASAALRQAHEDRLDQLIGAWTGSRDKWEVTRALQADGVAAFPSLSPAELWNGDPQLDALGMLERPEHPATGPRVIPGIPWRLTNGPNGLRRPAPLLGQHTAEVLAEVLGYGDDDIEHLVRTGAIPLNE